MKKTVAKKSRATVPLKHRPFVASIGPTCTVMCICMGERRQVGLKLKLSFSNLGRVESTVAWQQVQYCDPGLFVSLRPYVNMPLLVDLPTSFVSLTRRNLLWMSTAVSHMLPWDPWWCFLYFCLSLKSTNPLNHFWLHNQSLFRPHYSAHLFPVVDGRVEARGGPGGRQVAVVQSVGSEQQPFAVLHHGLPNIYIVN